MVGTGQPAPVAPPGFAARVARRAFAGDPGLLPDSDFELTPHAAGPSSEDRILQFVLKLTAVAAAILFCLSLAIRTSSLPETEDLGATESYAEVLEDLERLNQAEARAEAAKVEESKAAETERETTR